MSFPLYLLAPKSKYDPPSPLYAFLSSPVIFATQNLYKLILFLRPSPKPHPSHPIRVVCISDTHTNIWHSIPDGDVLIHAGDLTNLGTSTELQKQINWLRSLPHPYKVAISGNHDTYLDPRSRQYLEEAERVPLDWGDVHYLQHRQLRLKFPHRGNRVLTVYGAPQVPGSTIDHPDWAFLYPHEQDAWSETVPKNTDILVTHGPPQWHKDIAGLGCRWLLSECWRVRPLLHVFGHIHAGRSIKSGRESVWWDECQQYYEKIVIRCSHAGWIRNLINIFNWLDLIKMCIHGFKSVAWRVLWGGDEKGSIMLNAALMYRSTGHLGNQPQVVDL